MVARTVLATLDGNAPQERLQVCLVQREDGRLAFDLREQHYAEGIGWYDQRTLELDPRQFRQLQAILGPGTAAMEDHASRKQSPMILAFPGPADRSGPTRRTGSDGL